MLHLANGDRFLTCSEPFLRARTRIVCFYDYAEPLQPDPAYAVSRKEFPSNQCGIPAASVSPHQIVDLCAGTFNRSEGENGVTPSEYSRKDRELLAVCLAAIAGYVDAYGFLTFSTFVSFMSGNTTHAGIKLGLETYDAALPAATAILSFVTGVFAGTLMTNSRSRQSRRILYLTTAALLALNIGASHLASALIYLGIAMLSFTMGMMNTVLSRVGKQTVNITFVTGTLSQIGGHLALAAKRAPLKEGEGVWDTHLRRAMLLTVVWVGFLIGALLGGAATPRFGVWLLLLPLLIMLALAVLNPARSTDD